jgi:hypothetical protein
MRSRLMGMQVKAFAGLFVVLLAWDAFAYHGEYRMWIGRGVASAFSSVHGLGPGRNWSAPRPSRNS